MTNPFLAPFIMFSIFSIIFAFLVWHARTAAFLRFVVNVLRIVQIVNDSYN